VAVGYQQEIVGRAQSDVPEGERKGKEEEFPVPTVVSEVNEKA